MNIHYKSIQQVVTRLAARYGHWVKYLAGAVLGALIAAGALTLTGCGVVFTLEPGKLAFSQQRPVVEPVVIQPVK